MMVSEIVPCFEFHRSNAINLKLFFLIPSLINQQSFFSVKYAKVVHVFFSLFLFYLFFGVIFELFQSVCQNCAVYLDYKQRNKIYK